jgi:hypothetical protein
MHGIVSGAAKTGRDGRRQSGINEKAQLWRR